MDTPARSHSDPAESVIACERLRALQQPVESTLSNLEAQVLQLRVEGRGQTEIAMHLQRHAKAVDNALQRVRTRGGGSPRGLGAGGRRLISADRVLSGRSDAGGPIVSALPPAWRNWQRSRLVIGSYTVMGPITAGQRGFGFAENGQIPMIPTV